MWGWRRLEIFLKTFLIILWGKFCHLCLAIFPYNFPPYFFLCDFLQTKHKKKSYFPKKNFCSPNFPRSKRSLNVLVFCGSIKSMSGVISFTLASFFLYWCCYLPMSILILLDHKQWHPHGLVVGRKGAVEHLVLCFSELAMNVNWFIALIGWGMSRHPLLSWASSYWTTWINSLLLLGGSLKSLLSTVAPYFPDGNRKSCDISFLGIICISKLGRCKEPNQAETKLLARKAVVCSSG